MKSESFRDRRRCQYSDLRLQPGLGASPESRQLVEFCRKFRNISWCTVAGLSSFSTATVGTWRGEGAVHLGGTVSDRSRVVGPRRTVVVSISRQFLHLPFFMREVQRGGLGLNRYLYRDFRIRASCTPGDQRYRLLTLCGIKGFQSLDLTLGVEGSDRKLSFVKGPHSIG